MISVLAASGASESLPEGSLMPVLTVGVLTFVVMAGAFVLFIRFLRRSQEAKVEAYRPLAEPLYTGAGASTVQRGWYPLPEGDRDRFHDGENWTEHYRDRTEASRLDDPAPHEVGGTDE